MQAPPFAVTLALEGWTLLWADLELRPAGDEELTELRRRVVDEVRRDRDVAGLATQPTVAALRKLFRAAGCDPTRYRPSSEALLRRILKGGELPAIHPLVDLNNCLSARLAVPCCVMAEGSFAPPIELRAGRAGESYESLKGPFHLESKPLLVDGRGPCDAPIAGSERVKVTPETTRAWLVAYLPTGVVSPEEAASELETLLTAAPVAQVRFVGASQPAP